MAYEDALRAISVPAGSDLSAKQYYTMTINSSGQLALAAPGDRPAGVLQDKPAAQGRAGRLGISGVTKAAIGGSVTKGDYLVVDANGALVTIASSDNDIVGQAMESGASGDVVSVLLTFRGRS